MACGISSGYNYASARPEVQGILSFISEPIADGKSQGQDKPRLPRFSMVAYPVRSNQKRR